MKNSFVHFMAVNLLHLTERLVGNVLLKKLSNENYDDHSFGKLYKWKNISDGFAEAKKTRKPIIVVVHRLGCSACANLRPKFASSLKLLDLSQHFVMVNVESSAEQKLPVKFLPDGEYVPRILFFCPDGKLLREIVNQDPNREPQYRYNYWSIGQIVDSMLRVLEIFPPSKNVQYSNENSSPITISPTSME